MGFINDSNRDANFQFPPLKVDTSLIQDISPPGKPNSVKKIIVREGIDLDNDALKCKEGSEVTIKYTGFLPKLQYRESSINDGIIFDSSSLHPSDFKLTVGQGRTVAGFEAGVASMRKGEVSVIVMASHVGYGERATGNIPADSSLGFVLHVTEVNEKEVPDMDSTEEEGNSLDYDEDCEEGCSEEDFSEEDCCDGHQH